ncbi:hypothetical protein [uncultured Alteromonas sp.]|jgi:ABC-type arginine transport system ATPase subunit|uniref:hypothetical protein n=1 Tax=uncultured Alteromonas sp. TaxID=179113 RepID=UPI0030DD0087
MFFISTELNQVGSKFIQHETGFHLFMSQVEAEFQTIEKSVNGINKWNMALCLRGFLDFTLDAYGLELTDMQRERVKIQRALLNKAILESNISEF